MIIFRIWLNYTSSLISRDFSHVLIVPTGSPKSQMLQSANSVFSSLHCPVLNDKSLCGTHGTELALNEANMALILVCREDKLASLSVNSVPCVSRWNWSTQWRRDQIVSFGILGDPIGAIGTWGPKVQLNLRIFMPLYNTCRERYYHD